MNEASRNDPTFTEMDYIACLLYQLDVRKRGHEAGPRWWCLREDLRQKFRVEARTAYSEWAQYEQATLEQRTRVK